MIINRENQKCTRRGWLANLNTRHTAWLVILQYYCVSTTYLRWTWNEVDGGQLRRGHTRHTYMDIASRTSRRNVRAARRTRMTDTNNIVSFTHGRLLTGCCAAAGSAHAPCQSLRIFFLLYKTIGEKRGVTRGKGGRSEENYRLGEKQTVCTRRHRWAKIQRRPRAIEPNAPRQSSPRPCSEWAHRSAHRRANDRRRETTVDNDWTTDRGIWYTCRGHWTAAGTSH